MRLINTLAIAMGMMELTQAIPTPMNPLNVVKDTKQLTDMEKVTTGSPNLAEPIWGTGVHVASVMDSLKTQLYGKTRGTSVVKSSTKPPVYPKAVALSPKKGIDQASISAVHPKPAAQLPADEQNFVADNRKQVPKAEALHDYYNLPFSEWDAHMVELSPGLGAHMGQNTFRLWHDGKHVATIKRAKGALAEPIFAPNTPSEIKDLIHNQAESLRTMMNGKWDDWDDMWKTGTKEAEGQQLKACLMKHLQQETHSEWDEEAARKERQESWQHASISGSTGHRSESDSD